MTQSTSPDISTSPDLDTDTLSTVDGRHLVHPYLPGDVSSRTVLVQGSGCLVRDDQGREYLDATGGLWLCQVGHGRAELARVAAEQMSTLEYFTTFWDFSNPPAIRLAERLAQISPSSVEHVFYTSGGSEGVEAALRMARLFHAHEGHPDRTWIIGRQLGYHGVGFGGGSASGLPFLHDGFGPGVADVRHLTPAYPYRRELYGDDDPTEYCVRELEQTIDELGAGRIAAMIAEPVMGVAGMIVPPADYWPRVGEVLRRHGILLILDEVVTAYGRTGSWFAADHYGVSPDIIVTSKGLTSGYFPVGAVLLSPQVHDVVVRGHGFPIGYTYGGHPTGCAVALANLDIIEREGLLAKATATGATLKAMLDELLDLPTVGEVRQLGMMLGIELVSDKATRTPLAEGATGVADAIRDEAGVIVRGGPTSLVLSPPLTMSVDEAAAVASAVGDVLRRLGTDGRVRPAAGAGRP